MHRMTRSRLLPVLLLLTFGCGGLANNQYAGLTLATVQGHLTEPGTTQVEGTIGMTIFWDGATTPGVPMPASGTGAGTVTGEPPLSCPAPAHLHDTTGTASWSSFVTQSVTYQPHFPVAFSIPITTVPPPSAQLDLTQFGGQGTLSMGIVVAYQDVNGNGAYDFGTPTREPEPILATSLTADVHSLILFLDGHLNGRLEIPGLPAGFDTQGFSVLTYDPAVGDLAPGPASTPISLVVGPNTATRDLGCASIQLDTVHDAAPLAGATTSCLNATGYIWQLTRSPSTCVQEVHTGVVCLGTSAPPADWPCH